MNNDWREYYDPQYVLMHHGVKGQKWGVRQYQNADGTLTEAGKKRYGSGADRVEKFARKAASWEGRAINAKTGIGRGFATSIAANKRMKADKAAAKATGDYKMLALNKNTSRNSGSLAETNANVAAGLKKRAESENGRKKERLMNAAVAHLAAAENGETAAKSYNSISNAKGLSKGTAFIRENLKIANNTYTSAGRKSTLKDKAIEAAGEYALDVAFGLIKDKSTGAELGTNKSNTMQRAQVVTRARDAYYKTENSASKRWDKIMKG